VENAVVVAIPTHKSQILPHHTPKIATMDQINKEFVPYVLPVEVGTTVKFPNKDNIRHHVYSFSPTKTFERPLYTSTTAEPVIFDKAGVALLGCNIHDWMIAYVYVTESPYFSKTGSDGKTLLSNIPIGSYIVYVWHPRLEGKEEETKKSIAVLSITTEVTFDVGLMPDFRVHRTPTIRGHGY
jgi:plastocyanin